MGGFEVIENEADLSSGGPSLTNLPRKRNGMEGEAQLQSHYHQSTNTKLYSLTEQIEHVEQNIKDFVDAWHAKNEQMKKKKKVNNGQEEQRGRGVKLILIGHSVGAYIAMEVLRRHRENIEQKKTSAAGEGGSGSTMDIIGGILLFPTVIDIAKSSSGRKFTVRFFSLSFHAVPFFLRLNIISSFGISISVNGVPISL